jgi:hypothetical protein
MILIIYLVGFNPLAKLPFSVVPAATIRDQPIAGQNGRRYNFVHAWPTTNAATKIRPRGALFASY